MYLDTNRPIPITKGLLESMADHWGTPHAFERGVEYYENGAVSELTTGNFRATAIIKGSEDYETNLFWTDKGTNLRGTCTCPVGDYFCKHQVALGLACIESNPPKVEPKPWPKVSPVEIRSVPKPDMTKVLAIYSETHPGLIQDILHLAKAASPRTYDEALAYAKNLVFWFAHEERYTCADYRMTRKEHGFHVTKEYVKSLYWYQRVKQFLEALAQVRTVSAQQVREATLQELTWKGQAYNSFPCALLLTELGWLREEQQWGLS